MTIAVWQRERWDPKHILVERRPVDALDIHRGVVLLEHRDPRTVRGYLLAEPDRVRSALLDPDGAVVLDHDQAPERPRTFLEVRTEPGDVVDLAVAADTSGRRVVGIWFHVWYENEHLREQYLKSMSKLKSDALFAARMNPARREEGHATRELLRPGGHEVEALHRPDAEGVFRFVIDYAVADRRRASDDLTCRRCGTSFEVKARLRDDRRRVSHSRGRPYWQENAPDGYLVFRYRRAEKWEVLSNRDVVQAMRGRAGTGRRGEQDQWTDIGFRGDPQPPALGPDDYGCVNRRTAT